MAAYLYKASTMEGKIVEGTIEASDNGAASVRIQDMGLLPIRVEVAAKKTALTREIKWSWRRKRVRRKDILVFTQELHTLVKSGFPLDRSLSVLGQLAESPTLAEVIQDVLKEVKGGKSLSEALAKYPESFPKIYVNMVKAGEVGGAMEEVLARLSMFLESSEQLHSYIVGALIYPVLLCGVGIASVTILTLFVVPRFAAIFQDMGLPLPLPMAILKGLSDFIVGYWWLVLISLALVGVYLQRFRASTEGRLKIDRFMLRIPLVGILVQKVEVSRFSRTLGTLLHGGVPLLQAMTIVKEIVGHFTTHEAKRGLPAAGHAPC
jgi:general secretion pathway protein F